MYAINMDGGGSSTIVMSSVVANLTAAKHDCATATTTVDVNVATGHWDYAVINRPTCLDLPFPHCQRAVSTVLCLSTNRTES